MKKLYFAFCFILPVALPAQEAWNVIPELSYPQSDITDMILDDDRIILYGDAFNNSVEWMQGLIVAKLDTFGNVIHQKFILDSLGDKLAVSDDWGKIICTSDGGYAATAATVFRKSAFLIKLDSALEVEFIREYPDSVNLSNFDYKPIEAPGGYLLYGSIQAPDYYGRGFVRYVDLEGNAIWEVLFENAFFGNRILDMARVSDSVFVCVTVEGLSPGGINVLQSGRSGIYHINLYGEILDAWQSEPEPEIGYLRKVVPLEEGSLITYGLSPKEIVGTTRYVQPTLAGFDVDFSVIWVQNFGNIRRLAANHTFWDFAPTVDGNYVGAGRIGVKTGTEPSRAHGWLFKFSPQGDSLWGRHFPTPFPDYFPHGGALYGVGVLPGGNIVAGGQAADSQHRYAWIVKMTNDGCMDTLFCEVTSTEDMPEPEIPANVEIFPNPARDYLTVAAGERVSSVRLFDTMGRLAAAYPGQGRLTVELDIPPNLSSGLYNFLIQFESGKLVSRMVYIK